MNADIVESLNTSEMDVLLHLDENCYKGQRQIKDATGLSLGKVNQVLSSLRAKGYLDSGFNLTSSAKELVKKGSPKRAVILAAGRGLRMIPVNDEVPKAFLQVNGEPLIVRIISQLHQVGITEIYIVVGFKKEQFEPLIDEYGVKLVVNSEYANSNTLHSLALVADHLSDCYVIPSDLWANSNPFSRHELYSWYMVTDLMEYRSDVRVGRNGELARVSKDKMGNAMKGITYLTADTATQLANRLREFDNDMLHADSFWEDVLYSGSKMVVPARVVSAKDVVEINTFEDLRELDSDSGSLHSDSLDIISKTFDVPQSEIKEIAVLKKGMTNRSFRFTVKGKMYIMRVPGEGTEHLIDRYGEARAYAAISGKGLCDDPVYLDPSNGYKITEYIDDVRCADPESREDIVACMDKLRAFHDMSLCVEHEFDIFRMVDFYESLWGDKESAYPDHGKTKANVLSLRPFIESHIERKCLTHIDAVPDNFLFSNRRGKSELQLTDWEYAGMQDPHVDIAMFCIYSMMEKDQIDEVIDIYFKGACPPETRIKIYCYIALCGLLWSDWCEYKSTLGVEFGAYSLAQYRFAKDFYRYAVKEMDRLGIRHE